jgi:hypothetical protein
VFVARLRDRESRNVTDVQDSWASVEGALGQPRDKSDRDGVLEKALTLPEVSCILSSERTSDLGFDPGPRAFSSLEDCAGKTWVLTLPKPYASELPSTIK